MRLDIDFTDKKVVAVDDERNADQPDCWHVRFEDGTTAWLPLAEIFKVGSKQIANMLTEKEK